MRNGSGPRKFLPLSEAVASRADFGVASEYALNYLNLNQDRLLHENDPRCAQVSSRRMIDVFNEWLQEVSPGAKLQLETVPAADALIAGFSFDRPGDIPTRRFRATNVGFGLSSTLPVILALLAESRTLCLIENPEAHLHPHAQTKLAELAVRASLAGVQVIVETHSDHFMDGVRISVRNGLTSPDNTAIHYFERAGRETVVRSPEIDDDGGSQIGPSVSLTNTKKTWRNFLPPKSNVREMVLNHASLSAPDRHKALTWLKDLAIGMTQLRRVAQSSLRTHLPIHEIKISSNLSLFDAYIELKRGGAREESAFLMRLTAKFPLESEILPGSKRSISGVRGTKGAL